MDLYIDNDSETVTVLEPTLPLTEDQMSMLSGEIDSLANSTNFGVDIPIKQFVTVSSFGERSH